MCNLTINDKDKTCGGPRMSLGRAACGPWAMCWTQLHWSHTCVTQSDLEFHPWIFWLIPSNRKLMLMHAGKIWCQSWENCTCVAVKENQGLNNFNFLRNDAYLNVWNTHSCRFTGDYCSFSCFLSKVYIQSGLVRKTCKTDCLLSERCTLFPHLNLPADTCFRTVCSR